MDKKIACAGEALIDLIASEPGDLITVDKFYKRPGGSILNTAVGLARLGLNVGFIGKLGGDQFGKQLLDLMINENINIDNVIVSEDHKTTLAFAALSEEKVPDFQFYRDNPADLLIYPEDFKELSFNDISNFHFGSISILHEPARTTFIGLFEKALENSVITSFDPNIRANLITDKKKVFDDFMYISSKVDILKMSDDDLRYLFPKKGLEQALKSIARKENSPTFVTLGKEGVMVYINGKLEKAKGYKVEVIDTTGCGDAFNAGLIYYLYKTNHDFNLENCLKAARFANKVAALTATKIGAINAFPTLEEVKEFEQEENL